jgi:hypothetical protein
VSSAATDFKATMTASAKEVEDNIRSVEASLNASAAGEPEAAPRGSVVPPLSPSPRPLPPPPRIRLPRTRRNKRPCRVSSAADGFPHR